MGRQVAQAALVGLLVGLMLCPPGLWVPPAWAAFDDVSATHLPGTDTVAYRVAVGDVNGDGAPDALVAVNGQSRLLMNDGTGAFTDVTATQLPVQEAITLGIALGDIDGDGDLDAVLAQATTPNQVWLGDGTGRFTNATAERLPGTTQLSLSVTLADVDGDGDLDLLVANRGSQNRLWLNNGQGSFGVSPTASLPRDQDPSYGVAVADIDGDHALDLLVVNQGALDRLLHNNGLGVFTDITATHLPEAATDSLAATFADVDGDGDADLLVAAGRDGLRLYHNDGQGQFTEGTATHLPALDAYGIQVVTGDVDVDGDLDLVLAAAGQDQVLLNDGSGMFTNATSALLLPDTQRSFGVAIADVDGDLDPDLLVATPSGPERLLLNALPFPRVRLAVTPDVRPVGLPVTLTIAAVDEDGLATARLTLTDPAGTPQTVDLLADLADGEATHPFTPPLAGTYTARVMVTDTLGETTTRQLAFAVETADDTAPTVGVAVETPTPVLVGQPVTLRVTASDDREVTGTTLTVNGTSVPLPRDGLVTVTPLTAELHTAEAQATDAAGNVGTASTSFAVDPDTAAPVVSVSVQPPTVDLTQPVAIEVTATDNVAIASLSAQVRSDVLPTGLPLALDATGAATFTPYQPGTYTVTATAHDPAGQTTTATAPFAAQGVADNTPPVVSLRITPSTVTLGTALTLTVTATDNVGVTATALEINGLPVAVDAAGQATYTPPVLSTYTAVALAWDGTGNEDSTEGTFRAIDPAEDVTAPVVAITLPAVHTEITAPTEILGTVQDETLVQYTLAYAPRGDDQFTPFARGTTEVFDGVLGTLDPTLLLNDLYDVRLTAEDSHGRIVSTTVVYQVSGAMKVGHFSITLQDLAIPLAGLPITINRHYDSRNKNLGDFGIGWSLDIQTVQLRESQAFGMGWVQEPSGSGFVTVYCLGIGAAFVSITLPDGRQESFDLVPETPIESRTSSTFGDLPEHCQFFTPIQFATATFQPRPGTFSTLEALADNELWIVGDQMLHTGPSGDFEPYEPTRYQLTTPEGLVFVIDQDHGVEMLTEPNGNTLTFADDGIHHSAGKSVLFTRDAEARITELTDPLGHPIAYAYDAAGDLVAVTDQEGQTTRYTYDAQHYLLDIEDPRGVTPLRNEYDDAGRLVAHIDADGNRLDFTHDIDGRQEIITDRLGNLTLLIYDDQGNVLSQTDPLGHTTTYTYDNQDKVLSQTDPLGHTTTYTYNARGHRLTETDPLGHTTAYTYDGQDHLLTLTNPLGHTISFAYDMQGNLATFTDALGHTDTYRADAVGNPLTLTDSLGYITTLAYDQAGRLLTKTDAAGQVTAYTHDANGNPQTETTTRTDADGQTVTLTTTSVYDRKNRAVQTMNVSGHLAFFTYDARGQLSAMQDAMGDQTTYTYDLRGQLLTTRYPDGRTETFTYDANGQRVRFTDRGGASMRYLYDAAGQLIQTVLPDGSSTYTEYDAAGRVQATVDELGHRTAYTYNAASQVVVVTDALGEMTTLAYDAAGRLLTMTDALGHITTFTSTAHHRPTQTTFPDGTFTTVTYNSLGWKVAEADQAGQVTQFAYDAVGRLLRVTDALGHSTTYTYDEVGNRLTQTDAQGHTTHWAYDNHRRAVARTLPLGMTETLTYDPSGNLLTITDFQGQTTTRAYDVNAHMREAVFPDGRQVTYAYTPTGQPATVTDARGMTTYHYDLRDRLIEVRHPEGTFLRYAYDAVGNRTAMTTPAGTTTYTYDAQNQLRTVTAPDGEGTTYTYDAVGQRTHMSYPQGTVTTYQHDPLQRLQALEIQTAAGGLLARYAYTVDATGRRVGVEEHTGRQVMYAYDAIGRLRTETRHAPEQPTETVTYTYDAAGNRLSKTAAGTTLTSTYDANDRLLTAGAATYTYNDNGQMVHHLDGDTVTTYAYDASQQLRQVQTPTHLVTYAYDADGQRIGKALDGVETHFLVDTASVFAEVVEERDETGTVRAAYVHGADLIRQQHDSTVSYVHADGLGSTRLLTDVEARLTDTYTYDAFGALLDQTGQTPNPYRFLGEYAETEVALYYLRARYLQPATGRFLTLDPFAGDRFAPLTLHRYLYAGADPVNNWDPSGEVFNLVDVSIAHSIRNTLAGIQSTTGLAVLDGVSGGEEAVYLGLAFALAPFAIGIAVRPLIRAAKMRVHRGGGWLGIHEGVRLNNSLKSPVGHTITEHVGKSPRQLKRRLTRPGNTQHPGPGGQTTLNNILEASTYYDQVIAEKTILAALKKNAAQVQGWVTNPAVTTHLSFRYCGAEVIGFSILKGAKKPATRRCAYVQLNKVRASGAKRKWIVCTSYPAP